MSKEASPQRNLLIGVGMVVLHLAVVFAVFIFVRNDEADRTRRALQLLFALGATLAVLRALALWRAGNAWQEYTREIFLAIGLPLVASALFLAEGTLQMVLGVTGIVAIIAAITQSARKLRAIKH